MLSAPGERCWTPQFNPWASHTPCIKSSAPTTSLFTSLPANSFAASCASFALVVLLLTITNQQLLSEPLHTVKLSQASNNPRVYSDIICEYLTPINHLWNVKMVEENDWILITYFLSDCCGKDAIDISEYQRVWTTLLVRAGTFVPVVVQLRWAAYHTYCVSYSRRYGSHFR